MSPWKAQISSCMMLEFGLHGSLQAKGQKILSDFFFKQGPLIHADQSQETWKMVGMQERMLVARRGIQGPWPQPRPLLPIRRETIPSVFPGRGYDELMPGYGFLKARRIILNLFPQGLNRPYIRHWARSRLQLAGSCHAGSLTDGLPAHPCFCLTSLHQALLNWKGVPEVKRYPVGLHQPQEKRQTGFSM